MEVKYKVFDNFLSLEEHKLIEKVMIGFCDNQLPWFYYCDVVGPFEHAKTPTPEEKDTLYNFQLVHVFYMQPHGIVSDHFNFIIAPILNKINYPLALLRAKANLNPVYSSIEKHGWHKDYRGVIRDVDNETSLGSLGDRGLKTAIYYVNSNNGKTILEDNVEVESIANRLLVFNSDLEHTGTTCTDSKVRCVINLNFF